MENKTDNYSLDTLKGKIDELQEYIKDLCKAMNCEVEIRIGVIKETIEDEFSGGMEVVKRYDVTSEIKIR